MKNKTLPVKILEIVALLLPTLFLSCNNETMSDDFAKEEVSTKDIKIIVNKEIFKELSSRKALSRATIDESNEFAWNIINASFEVVKDNKTMSIHDYFKTLGKNQEETKDLILGKILLLEYPGIPTTRGSKKKPSLEEIRNAMMDECDHGYIDPVTTACKAAVLIAYYYKKLTS